MLPSRISKSLQSLHRQPYLNPTGRRHASNASGYSSKVRAIPFVLSAEEAIRHLGPYASLSGMGTSMLGSLGAKFFPGLGFQSYQPNKIQALYVPAWFVDAEVTATIGSPHSERPVDTHMQSINSYMPGFTYEPLSKLSFLEPSMYTLTVPFTSELKRQHDSDIICLPYTLSPLCLPQLGQSMLLSEPAMKEVRFDPTSPSFHLLAAYPILLPVYLAQYEYKFGGKQPSIMFTCVIQAHSHKGMIYLDDIGSELGKLYREISGNVSDSYSRFTHLLDDQGFVAMRGLDQGFAQISTITPSSSALNAQTLASEVSSWLDNALITHGLKALAEFGVDMDDLRIREYVPDEISANRTWMSLGEELFAKKVAYATSNEKNINLANQLRQQLAWDRTDGTEHPLLAEISNTSRAMGMSLNNDIQLVEHRRKTTKPQWLKDWEELQEERDLAKKNRREVKMV